MSEAPQRRRKSDVPYTWGERYRLIIAYAVLAAGVTYALVLASAAQDRIEEEALIRSYVNCKAVNDLRDDIVAFMMATGDPVPFPDDMDESVREWLETQLASSQQQRSELGPEMFALVECPPDPVQIHELDSSL